MFSPSDFLRFLRSPKIISSEVSVTNMFMTALKIYLASLILIGLVNFLNITMLTTFVTLPHDMTFDIPERFQNNFLSYFAYAVLLVPVFEETVFRLPLKITPLNISLAVSTLCLLLFHKILPAGKCIFLSSLVFIIFYLSVSKCRDVIEEELRSKYKWFFYILTLSFGLVHCYNYKVIFVYQFFLLPVLVLPQLLMGLVLSFSRIYYKNGFFISLLIHILMNSAAILTSSLNQSVL